MLFWLGEIRSRATFDAFFNFIRPIKCDKFTYGIWFIGNRLDDYKI